MSRRDLGKAMYGAVLAGASSDAAARATPGGPPPGNVILIRGGYVMTMDAVRGDLPGADILVRDGRIAEIGRGLPAPEGADIVEAAGAVVLPGFVDAHTHGAISQMRGLYGNTPETAFFPVTNRLSAHYRPEDTYIGMLLSAVESLASGITTTADFFDAVRDREHAEAGLRALRDAQIRARLLYGMTSKTAAAPIDLAHVEEWQRGWADRSAGGRLSLGLAWRLPQDLDDARAWAIKQGEWEAARRLGLPVQVHVSGTVPGRAEAMFDALIARRMLRPGLQVIHATDARDDQLAALEEAGAGLVVTPLTEHRVGYGLTRIDRFAGIRRLGFGIDGSALAGSTDMFALMRLAALTQAGAARDETAVSPRRLLELATVGGARAMGLDAEIGTLVPGRAADLQIVRLDTWNLAGFKGGDPSALLVYSARPEDVATVMVGGRLVKHDRRLLFDDLMLLDQARLSILGICRRSSQAGP
ncbi:amidohydrolase family protein [Methylobacterium sp. J-043]|uniref:amidohydrolase family protein n=1 Tax=Methylobacteriaceae TaxID=119045 RepID=UPI000B0A5714|nr:MULTISPECIES: amidohydrolase family protein [Methylobacteriaceae]MCJ2029441.1 amidohydrolase family protein [Methylobacterium sp. J-043]MCP1551614.1 cytosine/adenosine deaminase-related metal-dependent hydrolase [Methylorubrum zatmanii]MCP1556551.1 cytosine/adenosine deaminase-related metal-dependent hydrolase [Methylorubrum extorquens]MCP1581788.1 cytosine/adenosine deaminase-related metal-dependent hydrolase [Methylorubrum extorquens]